MGNLRVGLWKEPQAEQKRMTIRDQIGCALCEGSIGPKLGVRALGACL